MNGNRAYLELIEHGLEYTGDAPNCPKAPILDLLEFSEGQSHLEMASAWRLAPGTARRIEDTMGYAPDGGWGALVVLAAASGFFAVREEGFVPLVASRNASTENIRSRLMEGFTRWLAPPQTMAGLLVGMGLHPMWGLRVAHEVRSRLSEVHTPLKDGRIFPAQNLRVVEEMMFGAIGAIFGVLGELDPTMSYPVDALAQVIATSFATSRQTHAPRMVSVAGALPVFADVNVESGCQEFASQDLLRAVLIPAGAARVLPNDRFVTHDEAFKKVRIGELTNEEVATCCNWFRASDPATLVA